VRKKAQLSLYIKWFDQDLITMRRDLIYKSSKYAENPLNIQYRNSFFKFRKMYNRLCKKKKRDFVQTVFTKLDSLVKNVKETYWKMIQELENDSSNDSSDPSKKIPSTTLDFFQ